MDPPWEWPWWRARNEDSLVLPWFILIHLTALAGLILFPLSGWRVLLGSFCLVWLGGMATTVCYHRALAHRALRLNPWLISILTFFAVFNGSGTPLAGPPAIGGITRCGHRKRYFEPGQRFLVGTSAMALAVGRAIGRAVLPRA